jgi:hypothetical protein
MKKVFLSLLSASLFIFTSCDKHDPETPQEQLPPSQIITATGDSTGISAKLIEFRNLIGATLNTTIPGAPDGRREINWDAVPASFTNNNNFPPDFFNNTDPAAAAGRKRGFVLTNTGGFRVDSTNFVDIASSYTAQFQAFSPKRLFMSVGSNTSVAEFRVPGTNTPAYVKSFGVIFVDVDQDNTASIEFFDGDRSLGKYNAPKATGNTKQFSFLGVRFPNNRVTKVVIRSGQSVLGSTIFDVTTSGGTYDLVTMDDFLYNEPVAIQ